MATKKKDPVAVALAKKRTLKLSPERRKEIAQSAAKARWDKEYKEPEKK